MFDGVINIYKEKGFTSFDVVAKLRGILKQKKIGHTGTLDPDAEGVLVVCLGKATKLCDVLTDKNKCYKATMQLGITTDTEDSSGTVQSKSDVTVSEEQVRETILSFVGEYDQIPPMYSAIKINGKKLYELARQGKVIEREPRRVAVHEIQIESIDLPYVRFMVSCSKGTYIRSLCRDIGAKLGCGAIMEALVRTEVNAEKFGAVFTLDKAMKLSDVERAVEDGTISSHILPIDQMFPHLLHYTVTNAANSRLLNGNLLSRQDFAEDVSDPADGEQVLVYDKDGTFKAIYRYQQDNGVWKADKMFL
ncbi:MAG: tRNA pseudouridine(55) synthase TruB [Clostridiales bacterium]|nr:tRNA pseudouridine(55) synthase TruB [Clostridiales bacterium]